MEKVIHRGLERSREQALLMAQALRDTEGLLPRSADASGALITSGPEWWCSGFFPGVLWYLYEDTGDSLLKEEAIRFTSRVESVKNTTTTHDLGFMLFCSFGNGYRLSGQESYKEVLLTGARSLSTRYNDSLGLIKSWDFDKSKWQYPVIVDNMMNLELLTWASKISGEKRFRDIAKTHADRTLQHHFRPDFSSYHVVSYDTLTYQPHRKQTHQGLSDDSAWARGQAWGLYGYVMMYRETGEQRYLVQANGIAEFIMKHPNLPSDKIPYWDFNAPASPETPRDASSAAIMASALIELSGYNPGEFGNQCMAFAESQLRSLSSPAYLAEPGTNGNFILKHGTGNFPGGSEIDVPLTYGDYYYVEALMRWKKMKALEQK